MEKLKLEHVTPYLPYGLKCQYIGIVNSENYNKLVSGKDVDYFALKNSVYGDKIAEIKELKIFKKYWKVYIGIYRTGLKGFVNGYDFKPILRPLSDLTNPCLVDGIIPLDVFDKTGNDKFEYEDLRVFAILRSISDGVVDHGVDILPYYVIERLFQWHFDVFGLIEKGLAIDINTLR